MEKGRAQIKQRNSDTQLERKSVQYTYTEADIKVTKMYIKKERSDAKHIKGGKRQREWQSEKEELSEKEERITTQQLEPLSLRQNLFWLCDEKRETRTSCDNPE